MINWFIHADKNVASARLQGYLVHSELSLRNYSSCIQYGPLRPEPELPLTDSDLDLIASRIRGVAVFQKVYGPVAAELVKRLRQNDVRTVSISCDIIPNDNLVELVDQVICPTKRMAQHLERRSKAIDVIPDLIEHWSSRSTVAARHVQKERLRVAWIGHPNSFDALIPVAKEIENRLRKECEIVTISTHPQATVKWTLDSARASVESCDVGIVPVSSGLEFDVKSNNRVTLLMALGLPVVASPLDSYREVIDHGSTGYFARSPMEFVEALRLLTDPRRRRQIAEAAFDRVSRAFSTELLVSRWWEVLSRHIPSSRTAQGDLFDGLMNLRLAQKAIYHRQYRLAWQYGELIARGSRSGLGRLDHGWSARIATGARIMKSAIRGKLRRLVDLPKRAVRVSSNS